MKRIRRRSGAAGLEAIKARHCEAARKHLLAGEADEASSQLEKAELVERLSRLHGPRSSQPVLRVAMVGACVLLVLVAWKLKLATFADLEVSVVAETTAAELALARATTFEPVSGGAVDLARLTALAAQISEMPRVPARDGWARVQGPPSVEVQGLQAAATSRISMALVTPPGGAPALSLRAYAKGVQGDLLVSPGASISAGAGDAPSVAGGRLPGDVLDVVSFGCDDCTETPLRLDVRSVEPFAFGNVPASELAFTVEHTQPDGTVYFTSGLRGGSIRVLDADRSETIQAGDNLRLDVAHARRLQISRGAKEGLLSVVYEGSVKRISLGPLGAEKDLSPSVLEWVYRQKAFALLWGAGVFLWGLFVGMRRLWRGGSA